MARSFTIVGLAVLGWTCLCAPAQNGGRFALAWYALQGGGGISTGGNFALNGSVIQPGGALAGQPPFFLQAGFWSGPFAVQSVTAPALAALRVGGQITISWPGTVADYVLESTDNLSGIIVWTAVSASPEIVGNRAVVTLPVSATTRFFRLRRIPSIS